MPILVFANPQPDGRIRFLQWHETDLPQQAFGAHQDGFLLDTPTLGLPPSVRIELAVQFHKAGALAPAHFPNHRNDEDTLTGAFGAVLADTVKGEGNGFRWKTAVKKVRGRGKGAGERRFGADMAIEILTEVNGTRRLKTLLVQAKKEWNGADAQLRRQAQLLAELPGGGLVLDYRPGQYRAVAASVAVDAGGNARRVPASSFREIGDVLAGDFLDCTVGSTSVAYFVTVDRLVIVSGVGVHAVRELPFTAGSVLTTTVTER
jgi:hypothetical protein